MKSKNALIWLGKLIRYQLPQIIVCNKCDIYGAEDNLKAFRKKYGKKLCFKGGIDKHALRKDKDTIRAELEYKIEVK